VRPPATTTGPPADERLRLNGGINVLVSHHRSGWSWRPTVSATVFAPFKSKQTALSHATWLIGTLGYGAPGRGEKPPTDTRPGNPGG
jgi:hypothetical protein